MPNAKTALRVGLAAVAVPGAVMAVAAPAASAAELPSTSVAGHDVSHANVADAQKIADKGAAKSTDKADKGDTKDATKGAEKLAQSQGSSLTSNHINDVDMHSMQLGH